MRIMGNFKIVLILVLGLYGCMDRREVDRDDRIGSVDSLVTIVVDSKMDIPVAILRTESFSNFGKEVNVLSKKFKDTLSIVVNGDELLMVSHKGMRQRDSIFIAGGDTLFLDFSKNGSLNKNKVQKNRKQIPSTFLRNQQYKFFEKEMDSIAQLFYAFDSSQTLELSNDWEKLILYQIVYNHNYAKSHQEELHNLIDRKISFFKDRTMEMRNVIKAGILRNKLFNELTALYVLSNNPDSLFTVNMDLFLNEWTPSYPFGQVYLEHAIYDVFFKQLSERSRSQLHYDQFAIYDSLPRHFDSTLVRYGRMICLREMAEQADSFKKVANYFDKFNAEYGNTAFKEFFQNTYLTGLRTAYTSKGDMNVMGPIREVKTLKNILSENKGKVIYIDFWASWCAPCLDAMPAAKELRLDYEDREVYFLYVSIDRNYGKWMDALNSTELEDYSGNYLLLNQESSDMINDLKIEYIPRYLVFDRNGELVHQNAPGPKGGEIRQVLNKYLAEKTIKN